MMELKIDLTNTNFKVGDKVQVSETMVDSASWECILNENERKALASGISPLLIRPEKLVSWHK